jgi:5-methyltetrahydropteroyltriglutamate--homocysteine methyltransferase
MKLPTEPIGSIPRPLELIEAIKANAAGKLGQDELDACYDRAVQDTIRRFEATGSPVITDGEQTKPSFVTYPISGMQQLDPNGVVIPFADGHTRQLPKLTKGPFRYQRKAVEFYTHASKYARVPVKQAVISASALSLLYPQEPIAGYSRESFMTDLLNEHESDIRSCLVAGAYKVQIDFTEARLSLKLDPGKGLLRSFIALNNQVLSRFTGQERRRLGVHTCPGGDRDSTHSADVDYAELLPLLFDLNVQCIYLQYASEKDRRSVLQLIKNVLKPDQCVFLGVTDVLSPRVETPEEVRDLILQAAEYLPTDQLGTTDDCGFAPFADDDSTSRDLAFAKIKARVEGTRLAAEALAHSPGPKPRRDSGSNYSLGA